MKGFGNRRFPEVARYYELPSGHEPREISEAPVQLAHVLNAPMVGGIMAFGHFGGTSPVAKTAIAWTLQGPGVDGSGGAHADLPPEFAWRILAFGNEASGAGCEFGLIPYLNEARFTAGTLGMWWPFSTVGTATQPREATSPEPGELFLPYGGELLIIGDGIVIVNQFDVWAFGMPRASLVQP